MNNQNSKENNQERIQSYNEFKVSIEIMVPEINEYFFQQVFYEEATIEIRIDPNLFS